MCVCVLNKNIEDREMKGKSVDRGEIDSYTLDSVQIRLFLYRERMTLRTRIDLKCCMRMRNYMAIEWVGHSQLLYHSVTDALR